MSNPIFNKSQNKTSYLTQLTYGIDFKNFCDEKGFLYKNIDLIQESFLLIKCKDKLKIQEFISTWSKLKSFCDDKDKERGQNPLGYGEGYSISVAAESAGLKVHTQNTNIDKFSSSIRHYAWEPI